MANVIFALTVLFFMAVAQTSFAQTTFVKRVVASSDDAEEAGPGATNYGTPIAGYTYLISSDLELVKDNEPEPVMQNQIVGLRFTAITIPKGATITNAYLTFYAVAADAPMTNSEATNLTIKGHLTPNSTTFIGSTFATPTPGISNRTTTTASAAWAPGTWASNTNYNSPDIKTIIQEIVNQGTWSSGNALSIIITGTGHRSAASYDGNAANAPKLTVTYTTTPCLINGIVTKTNVSCTSTNDGTITVSNPTGGGGTYQYRLDDGSWQSSGSFTGLTVGTYSVQMRDAANTVCEIVLGNIDILGYTPGVRIDAVSSGQGNSGNTITVSHTTGTGNNRLMLVGISTRDRYINLSGLSPGDETSNVTYAGFDLVYLGTSIGSTSADKDAVTYIFMLLDPPSGTADLVTTYSSNLGNDNRARVGVITFSNVEQNNPIGAYQVANGSSTSPSLIQLSTLTSQTVFNVLATTNKDVNPIPNNSQTERWKDGSDGRPTGAGYTLQGQAGSTTSAYTIASQKWSLSGVAINPIFSADLGITKTVNNDTPYAGQTITFTLTANNYGCDNAPGVTVQDILPSGYIYLSHSTATGTYDGETGVWNIGTLNVGASATMTISAVVKASGTYNNTATISGNVDDQNSGNNSASSAIVVCQAGGIKPYFN